MDIPKKVTPKPIPIPWLLVSRGTHGFEFHGVGPEWNGKALNNKIQRFRLCKKDADSFNDICKDCPNKSKCDRVLNVYGVGR